MRLIRKITDSVYLLGGNDRRLALFENVYPIPCGVSYNSYFIDGEKTVLVDTVDKAVSDVFDESLAYLLRGRKLDYIIINHMEPDHAATLGETMRRYPEAEIFGSAKTLALIKQFFDLDIEARFHAVKDGETLTAGAHELAFYTAPMVHWPEVTVTYDKTEKILFSADAFGTFGALNGCFFADETDFMRTGLSEARRYYTNIVGKYGVQVQALLKKASTLDIAMLCPLHGPIWREDLDEIIEKYKLWSGYIPEEKAVMIAYGTIYGNTGNVADLLAAMLGERGIKNISVYDVSAVHPSVLVGEAFRCSHLVFASATYNNEIFTNMETVLRELKEHNLKNRTAAIIENGSWAPSSGGKIRELLSSLGGFNILEKALTLKSTLKENQYAELEALADEIANSIQNMQ